MHKNNILITGCAGFIGYHLALKILKKKKIIVYGIDSLNNYYDINLKKKRLNNLSQYTNFIFYKSNLENINKVNKFFENLKITYIFHFAAQAGIRLSFTNPEKYFDNNMKVFFNILEISRLKKIKRLFYASSSSVYGNHLGKHHEKLHLNPINFYGLTKKMNEEMADIYFKQFKIKSIGLRFFTVYGEYGRPDMAYFSFTNKILNNKKIILFNKGNDLRDYSYIKDVIESIYLILTNEKKCESSDKINIGFGKPRKTSEMLSVILSNIPNKKVNIEYAQSNNYELRKTYACTKKLYKITKYKPKYNLEEGLSNFIKWFNI